MGKIEQSKIPQNRVSETPEYWVVIRISTEDNIDIPYYKVFGGWRGGYLDGDRWKLNSGITKVEEDDDYYYFSGFSGSCYKCHKKGYGLKDGKYRFSSYVHGVLENIIEKSNLSNINVEVMPEDTNWKNLL